MERQPPTDRKLVPIKFVAPCAENPLYPHYVTDFELVELMTHPRVFMGQAKKIEYAKRFEVEHKFLETIVADVDKLMAASARMDVEMKVIKTRDVSF
uniref:Uncharacterized protein n=1 Tax=Caenorhabditis japonica TaxID=281687 RepID=A0A8R1EJ24_CAEJA